MHGVYFNTFAWQQIPQIGAQFIKAQLNFDINQFRDLALCIVNEHGG